MRAVELRREKLAADFKISFARRSSAFSRFNTLTCLDSSVLTLGRAGVDLGAADPLAQSLRRPDPSCAAIDLIASNSEP